MSNLGPDYKKQEEDAFKAAEDFKVEKSNLNLEENSAVNDMDKTLEKKDLKEKKDIGKTYTKEQVTEMVKEYKILVEKDKTGEPLTEEEEFERDRLKIILDKIGVETRSGKIEGTVEEFNEAIKDYNGSMKDYNRSIELDPQGLFYYDRGELKFETGDVNGACEDWRIAKNKGFTNFTHDSLINEYCNSLNVVY